MSFLQNHPALLETAYDATTRLLRPWRRWLRRGGATEKLLVVAEQVGKGAVFDCRMCGECVLHNTGMTCPMTCPKNMRNGPCGGVRPDGRCEVLPDQPCIWTEAWQRAARMPKYGGEIQLILSPLDRRQQDRSAWLNDLLGLPDSVPQGWAE